MSYAQQQDTIAKRESLEHKRRVSVFGSIISLLGAALVVYLFYIAFSKWRASGVTEPVWAVPKTAENTVSTSFSDWWFYILIGFGCAILAAMFYFLKVKKEAESELIELNFFPQVHPTAIPKAVPFVTASSQFSIFNRLIEEVQKREKKGGKSQMIILTEGVEGNLGAKQTEEGNAEEKKRKKLLQKYLPVLLDSSLNQKLHAELKKFIDDVVELGNEGGEASWIKIEDIIDDFDNVDADDEDVDDAKEKELKEMYQFVHALSYDPIETAREFAKIVNRTSKHVTVKVHVEKDDKKGQEIAQQKMLSMARKLEDLMGIKIDEEDAKSEEFSRRVLFEVPTLLKKTVLFSEKGDDFEEKAANFLKKNATERVNIIEHARNSINTINPNLKAKDSENFHSMASQMSDAQIEKLVKLLSNPDFQQIREKQIVRYGTELTKEAKKMEPKVKVETYVIFGQGHDLKRITQTRAGKVKVTEVGGIKRNADLSAFK